MVRPRKDFPMKCGEVALKYSGFKACFETTTRDRMTEGKTWGCAPRWIIRMHVCSYLLFYLLFVLPTAFRPNSTSLFMDYPLSESKYTRKWCYGRKTYLPTPRSSSCLVMATEVRSVYLLDIDVDGRFDRCLSTDACTWNQFISQIPYNQ